MKTMTSSHQIPNFPWGPKFKLAEDNLFVFLLLASLIASLELSIALFNLLPISNRRKISVLRTLVLSKSCVFKICPKTRFRKPRRFWIRPGRTSALWGYFVSEVVIREEWKEDFGMSCTSLIKLSEELRSYIEGKSTRMRQPAHVVKKVACTLHYLSNEGRLGKNADAFGLSGRHVV